MGEPLNMKPPHRLWRTPGKAAWCDCPVGEDHNENAWRDRHCLDEMGCPCDRELAAVGVHDSFKCPLGIWRGPL